MDVSGRDASDHHVGTLEGPITVTQAKYDPFFTRNLRVIEDLLIDEKRYHSTPGFCVSQSLARTTWMRRSLLNWLRDICIHRGTDGEVLAHTAQLIDRYMHIVPTEQNEYQLVGATCFFISSKLKETVPIALRKVTEYTANSLTEQDVLAKELTVCISLMWDLTCITPVDFVAPVVEFLEFVPSLRQIIRQAALCIYIKAFHVEELGAYMPSYIAAACILYALNLTVHRDLSDTAISSVTRIQRILRLEARKMREAYQILQACFEPGTVQLSNAVLEGDLEPPDSPVRELPVHLVHQLHSSSNTPVNTTVLLPIATSVYMHPNLNVSNQSLLTSVDIPLSTSMVFVNNNVSFDRNCKPTTSASLSACSTSSPPSEAENMGLTELENENPRCTYNSNNRSRLSMPLIHYSHSTQFCHHYQ
ncbi:G1/S-specific cyclin-D2 [Schistosoma japonicum]|uniref:G1/S-specific cyclin-D2 n=1 Tax=Schistosoma japonicum TaxID=6182 RepID=A0A4Z2DBD5_SCHJA|nr:G1/S-specific cyclin-D1 [Schistosoma japonicum]TNN13739.1 G1/S-specific cyclin-D2 [Schistosoma japonicum]